MRNYIILVNLIFGVLLLNTSCSFKSKSNDQAVKDDIKPNTELSPIDLSKIDSDGDMVNDLAEKDRGTNPNIADLPQFNLKFMQDFSVKINWDNGNKKDVYAIDTKVARTSPDFKYRVGDLLIKDIALKSAAEAGSFADHYNGEFEKRDLDWVKYPEIDEANFQQVILDGSKLFTEKYKVTNITIDLENSLKLLPGPYFPEIKDLEVNFYYFDYEKEKYELLKTENIERHFTTDVNEVFNVKIENVPAAFIRDNYLAKGEFLFAEVKDFIIPSMNNLKYSELLASIKAKSNQVIVTSPKGTSTYYVGFNNETANINKILSSIFDKNYKIEEDKITRIGEFVNNLEDYKYLKELKTFDKTGKWFVLTGKINKHYLDFMFSANDPIIFSYNTGTELSNQIESRINSYQVGIDGKNLYQYYDLGEVSSNSSLNLQLKPNLRSGRSYTQEKIQFDHTMISCSGNCTKPEFVCNYEVNRFKDVNEAFSFDKNFKNELENIYLVINDEEFAISKLILDKLVSFRWMNNYLHIRVPDVSKIKEIVDSEKNELKLKIAAPKASTFNGIKWAAQRGRDGKRACFTNMLGYSNHFKVPVSVDSLDYNLWKDVVNWDKVGLKPSGSLEYYLDHNIDVASIIQNFYN